MEDMYSDAGNEEKPHGGADREEKNKHKEEGEGRRRLDEADRRKIAAELEKYTHPLNEKYTHPLTSIQVSITSAMAKWHPAQ